MIGEEEKIPNARDEGPGDAYLYDYFKYLTSVSLITLGAVFTLSQTKGAEGVPEAFIAGAAFAFVTSAYCAFDGAEHIVAAKTKGEPIPKKVNFYRKMAPKVYAVGIVLIAYIYGDVMNARESSSGIEDQQAAAARAGESSESAKSSPGTAK
jgi:hypothetical protein